MLLLPAKAFGGEVERSQEFEEKVDGNRLGQGSQRIRTEIHQGLKSCTRDSTFFGGEDTKGPKEQQDPPAQQLQVRQAGELLFLPHTLLLPPLLALRPVDAVPAKVKPLPHMIKYGNVFCCCKMKSLPDPIAAGVVPILPQLPRGPTEVAWIILSESDQMILEKVK